MMPAETKRSLLVVGECMMELSGNGNAYDRAFAGDAYNRGVYAKRRHQGIDVQILNAIGSDPVSKAMVAQWDRNRIGRSLVMASENAHTGKHTSPRTIAASAVHLLAEGLRRH